jgi:hypothetical protein
MTQSERPPILSYFEALEAKYSVNFTFDVLSVPELRTLELLSREAIETEPGLDTGDRRNLGILLKLVQEQLSYRQSFQWVHPRAASGR